MSQSPLSTYRPARDRQDRNLLVCGYVFAVVMPIVGFVLGVVTLTRPNRELSRHGLKIIGLSVAVFVIYVWLITKSAGSHTQYYRITYRTYE